MVPITGTKPNILKIRLGPKFESWEGHSVMSMTGTEPNVLKTNDVSTVFIFKFL